LVHTLVLGLLAATAAAQVSTPPPPPVPQVPATAPRLRVFLDCFDCFSEYLRDEIEWVDWVRQREDADVHLLSTQTDTGGGGSEVVLRFVGNRAFQGVNHELRVISLTGDPVDLRRRRTLRTVIVGLLTYLGRDGRAGDLGVTVRQEDTPRAIGVVQRDPWNAWLFSVRAGLSLDAEESKRATDWDLSASADRVTENWIISFGVSGSETREEFDLDEDDPLKVTRRERGFDWFLAKSLGPHWSFGFTGDLQSSTFGNVRFNASAAPAIEFSVFPYAEYATRRLLLQYSVGGVRSRYNEVTLFDKLEETLGQHEFQVNFEQEQPWGSLQTGFEFSQYLHDGSKYRLEVDGELSFRIARGLEFNLEGSASRIRDQLSLPRRDATPEEVLLRLRELQSGYELSFSTSISYSFGSIFNNVVNPRFGRR
jgi:hypothetical protein